MTEFDNVFLGREIHFLPNIIKDDEDLSRSFKSLLGSVEASKAKSVVYFYCSETPVPCVAGATTILYIGKTKGSIRSRYYKYSEKLSKGKNGVFYRNIINHHGGLKMGYFFTKDPRKEEKEAFSRFRRIYKQNPQKSKRC